MSKYSENYKKINDGYNMILATIDSTETFEQLQCIPNMVDNWVDLVDHYCNVVYCDRKDKNRKKNTNQLADLAKMMIEDLKGSYQEVLAELTPEPYEGHHLPIRVKTMWEMAHENEY